MRVSLGVVHGQEINSWYHHSMVGFLTRQDHPNGHNFDDHICVRSGPLLSAGRGVLVGQFLERTKADALLMLDSDMVYSPELIYQHVDLFEKCRSEYPDLGMLGGLAFISSNPRNANPLPNMWMPGKHDGQFLQVTRYPPDALMEIGATGAACVMIAREVLEKFAGERINPFHHIPLVNWPLLARNVSVMDPAQIEAELRYAVWGADQCGEDISFCMRVRNAGYRIMVHTGLKYDHAKSTLLGEQEFRTAYGLDAQGEPNVVH